MDLQKRFLITGGSGFIGTNLAHALLKKGSVTVLDLNPLQETVRDTGIRVVDGDVLNRALLLDVLRSVDPTVVVHMAAITGIARCAEMPEKSFQINVGGTYNVTQSLKTVAPKAKLIFMSSREVYGETLGDSTCESDICQPVNLYGLTKLLAEQVIQWASRTSGLCFSILRFTNVYGPGESKYAVSAFVQKAIKGQDLNLMGGEQTLNMLYVDDAVRAIELCLERGVTDSEVFNIASTDNVTVRELVSRILANSGSSVKTTRSPMRLTETRRFIPDLRKSRQMLGFSQSISLDEGLKRTINYWRNKT
jgi:nucleoside-diphosphate-sugar epimerase